MLSAVYKACFREYGWSYEQIEAMNAVRFWKLCPPLDDLVQAPTAEEAKAAHRANITLMHEHRAKQAAERARLAGV